MTWRAVVTAVAGRAVDEPVDRRLLLALGLGWPAVELAVRLGQRLDRPLPVRAPTFVVGHPRSGTTFLHRLLALDPRYATPTARQLLLPSASLQRAASALGRSSRARALAARAERRWLGGWADRHETGLALPEEDDWLLLHAGASPTLELLTGDPGATRRYWFGDHLPAEERDAVMRWYARCVGSLLPLFPAGSTWLSKNPHFTGWLRTLAARFPDARFVMLVRHPAEAVASRLALAEHAWRRGEPRPVRQDRRYGLLFEQSCALYREAEAAWATLPADRAVRVGYDGLVMDPVSVLEGLAERLGDRPSGDVRAAWREAAARARRRVPGPVAELRWFGIDPRRVGERLGDLDALWATVGRGPGRRR
ncbi:MAG: sulfotransferase [Alphaproteobacteria bacterium]|nr:sulfotransferase [Alphaproteobacteria bacterium]